jgi:hypothetical protein
MQRFESNVSATHKPHSGVNGFKVFTLFYFNAYGEVKLSPLGTTATSGFIVPAPDVIDKCGEFGGMRIDRGNPAPVSRSPPQIPLELGSNSGRRDVKSVTDL